MRCCLGSIKNNEMTQDDRWQKRYEEVKAFIGTNKRNPSKYVAEERLMVHFLKRGRKMLNAGGLVEQRFTRPSFFRPFGGKRQQDILSFGANERTKESVTEGQVPCHWVPCHCVSIR